MGEDLTKFVERGRELSERAKKHAAFHGSDRPITTQLFVDLAHWVEDACKALLKDEQK